jgi:hypothetical protein
MSDSPRSPRDFACGYIDRGWAPEPVPYRTKGPKLKDWGSLRLAHKTVIRLMDCWAGFCGGESEPAVNRG